MIRNFIRLLVSYKYLIWTMAKREVVNTYVGSMLGFVWTFIQPLVQIAVYWVVFEVGFRVQTQEDIPFAVWLTAGLAAWFIFADIVNGSTGSIVAHAALVKKTFFPPQILPVIKVLSCMVTHGVFIFLLLLMIIGYGLSFGFMFFQIIYYLFCLIFLSLSLSWLLSALNVFFRDIQLMIQVVLQVGLWATPILWDLSIMPKNLHIYFKLNPMWYVVDGYRDSLFYGIPFWQHPYLTVYFWSVSILLLSCGVFVFRKLKPQFADVL